MPLKHNDGSPVGDDKLNQTRQELVDRFDGLSAYPQAILGIWVHEGIQFEDTSVRLFVDAEDTEENRLFFRVYKETFLERFKQIEIYMVSYPVEII